MHMADIGPQRIQHPIICIAQIGARQPLRGVPVNAEVLLEELAERIRKLVRGASEAQRHAVGLSVGQR